MNKFYVITPLVLCALFGVYYFQFAEEQQIKEAAKKKELAGTITASWGDQMRSYVLAPYQMVKDLRTEFEVNNPQSVFDGDIDGFIRAGIRWRKGAH